MSYANHLNKCHNGYSQDCIKEAPKSLYERLGGIFNIALVVNRFSDQMRYNAIVGVNSPNPFLRDWWRLNSETRLPGLKWMRTLWVAHVSGGPYSYVATVSGTTVLGLENAHCPIHINSEEFDQAAAELADALDYYKVPAQEKSEVLAAFSSHKSEVIMGFYMNRCPFSGHK